MCEISEKWYKEGEARGEMKKAKEIAFELYNRKMPIEMIAAVLKVNLETVRGWVSEKSSVSR